MLPLGRWDVQSLARSPFLPAWAAATPSSEAGRAISRTIWACGDSTSQRMPPSSRANNLTARSNVWQERDGKGRAYASQIRLTSCLQQVRPQVSPSRRAPVLLWRSQGREGRTVPDTEEMDFSDFGNPQRRHDGLQRRLLSTPSPTGPTGLELRAELLPVAIFTSCQGCCSVGGRQRYLPSP